MRKTTLLVLLIFAITKIQAQDYLISNSEINTY
jgi:hypothetical protein